MRRLRFCIGPGVALMFPCFGYAQSNVTLYGIIDTAVEWAKADMSQKRLTSGGRSGSRFGFRGSEDLGGGQSVFFDLQGGVNTNAGTSAQGGRLFGRMAILGLSDKQLGSLALGRSTTPYFSAAAVIHPFESGAVGATLALQRSDPSRSSYVLPLLAQGRVDNSITYSTPTDLGGFYARLQYAPSENGAALGTYYGASVGYKQGPFDLAASALKQKAGDTGGSGSADVFMIGGNYSIGAMKLYAGFTRENNSCQNCGGALARIPGVSSNGAVDFRMVTFGLRYKQGAMTWIAQGIKLYDRSDYVVDPGNRDALSFAVGGEYALSKRTILYASAGTVGNKNGSNYVLSTGAASQSADFFAPGSNSRAYTVSTGISHWF